MRCKKLLQVKRTGAFNSYTKNYEARISVKPGQKSPFESQLLAYYERQFLRAKVLSCWSRVLDLGTGTTGGPRFVAVLFASVAQTFVLSHILFSTFDDNPFMPSWLTLLPLYALRRSQFTVAP